MAARVFSRIAPAVGKILYGEKWASSFASVTPPLAHSFNARAARPGHLVQKLSFSVGKLVYGEKWIWRQRFFVPRNANDIKNGIYQKRAVSHFKNIRGFDPAGMRDRLQGKVDEAQKYVKLVSDTGRLVSTPLQVAAVAIGSAVLIKTSIKEIKKPGSAVKEATASLKQLEESDEPDH